MTPDEARKDCEDMRCREAQFPPSSSAQLCVYHRGYADGYEAAQRERDLLPLLREKGLALTLHCTPEEAEAWITNRRRQSLCGAVRFSANPAAAAFEAIFEALHGATE